MDEASAWRELAVRFTELGQVDQNQLYACWSSSPYNDRGEQWFIAGSPEQPIIDSFEWAAERAAVLLGQPLGRPTLFHWLDLLRENSPRYGGGGRSESRRGDEIIATAETGRIPSVCIASAEYCYKLETVAIANREPAAARIEIISDNLKARARVRALEEYLVEKEKDDLRRKDSLADALNMVDEPLTLRAPLSTAVGIHVEPIADQLRRLREESRLTDRKLAEELGIDARSVERHFAGKATPRIGHIGGYERVFSSALKRKIVITKTPVKRR